MKDRNEREITSETIVPCAACVDLEIGRLADGSGSSAYLVFHAGETRVLRDLKSTKLVDQMDEVAAQLDEITEDEKLHAVSRDLVYEARWMRGREA